MIDVMDVTFMGAEPRMDGRLSRWRYRYRSVLAVLLLPSLLLIGVFSYYPAVRSLIGGFYQWNGFSPPTYAGISQFRQYLQAPTFGTEAKNIAILTGGSILISLVSQFTAAEVVTYMPRRAGAIAKYVLVLPIVLPPLVLIEVWAYLLQPGSGLIDRILGAVGLPQPTWLSDPHLALIGILLVGFPWISNLGFLIFLGGLQNLPRDVLDAGRLDGLSAVRRVFAIDIPLLMPQFRIVVILSGIFAVQNFVPILLLTNGRHGHRHPVVRRHAHLHARCDAGAASPDQLTEFSPGGGFPCSEELTGCRPGWRCWPRVSWPRDARATRPARAARAATPRSRSRRCCRRTPARSRRPTTPA